MFFNFCTRLELLNCLMKEPRTEWGQKIIINQNTNIPITKPSRGELRHSSVLPLFCIVTQLRLELGLPKHGDIDVLQARPSASGEHAFPALCKHLWRVIGQPSNTALNIGEVMMQFTRAEAAAPVPWACLPPVLCCGSRVTSKGEENMVLKGSTELRT